MFSVRWVESLEGFVKGPLFPLYVLCNQEDSLLLRLYGWRKGEACTGSAVLSHRTGDRVDHRKPRRSFSSHGSRQPPSFCFLSSGWIISKDLLSVFQWGALLPPLGSTSATSGLSGEVQLCPKWWLNLPLCQWHCLICLLVGKCPFPSRSLKNFYLAIKSGN